MKQLNSVRAITVDISYSHSDEELGSFRAHLVKNLNGGWFPVILLVSKGSENPLDHISLVYEELSEFISEFNLDISTCTIYVDLMEYFGVFQTYLFKWAVSKINGVLKNELLSIDLFSLQEEHRSVLQSFYKDRWSAFVDSCLTSEEKIKLIANILSSSIIDDKSANRLENDFKFRLHEALHNKSDFLDFFD